MACAPCRGAQGGSRFSFQFFHDFSPRAPMNRPDRHPTETWCGQSSATKTVQPNHNSQKCRGISEGVVHIGTCKTWCAYDSTGCFPVNISCFFVKSKIPGEFIRSPGACKNPEGMSDCFGFATFRSLNVAHTPTKSRKTSRRRKSEIFV